MLVTDATMGRVDSVTSMDNGADRHGRDGSGIGVGVLFCLPMWLGVAALAASL